MGSREKVKEEEEVTEERKKEENEEGGEGKTATTMNPWEQHVGVISIPYYDYKAPSSLLSRYHSRFLITCSIKREKSATKEPLQVLQKYAELFKSGSSSLLKL